jgi:TPP-dependent indolepyruvate ferredoxin oxidoreductase alpha subunit
MNIKVTLDRFEGKRAVLIMESGEKIIIAKNLLPENAKESNVYYISIKENPMEGETDMKKAKEILNEILNPASSE